MPERIRFPGYSTYAKRDTPSWNQATRIVVEKRLFSLPPRRFFTEEEWPLLKAVCDRIIPQESADRVPLENFIDQKMAESLGDGYQKAGSPDMQQMWRRGLHALNEEAKIRFGQPFIDLPGGRQDDILHMVQQGDVRSPAWEEVAPTGFFKGRLLHDIVTFYYGHPKGWDEMGFGGPASPRGYVRMGFDRHDPWDPVPAKPLRSDA